MSVNRTSLGKRISFYRSKSNLTQEVLPQKSTAVVNTLSKRKWHKGSKPFCSCQNCQHVIRFRGVSFCCDCLKHFLANSEFHRLLLDCNETEQTVIIRMAKELKATLVSLGI